MLGCLAQQKFTAVEHYRVEIPKMNPVRFLRSPHTVSTELLGLGARASTLLDFSIAKRVCTQMFAAALAAVSRLAGILSRGILQEEPDMYTSVEI